jgi:hypothetical protein
MRKIEQVRWSIEHASYEFGITGRTLSKRIKTAGIVPGKDGKFSTLEICQAIYSDLKAAELEYKTEMAGYKRLQKLQLAKKLCVLDTAMNVWRAALEQIRQRVQNWNISDNMKKEMLHELQEIPVQDYFPETAPTPEVEEED